MGGSSCRPALLPTTQYFQNVRLSAWRTSAPTLLSDRRELARYTSLADPGSLVNHTSVVQLHPILASNPSWNTSSSISQGPAAPTSRSPNPVPPKPPCPRGHCHHGITQSNPSPISLPSQRVEAQRFPAQPPSTSQDLQHPRDPALCASRLPVCELACRVYARRRTRSIRSPA